MTERVAITAHAFVRGVLIDVFGQRATDADIEAVAAKVAATFCYRGLVSVPATHPERAPVLAVDPSRSTPEQAEP